MTQVFLPLIFGIDAIKQVCFAGIVDLDETSSGHLGKVIHIAWHGAPDHRPALQDRVLCSMVEQGFCHPRKSANARQFMTPFHIKRRRDDLSAVLVLLYEEALLRHHRSSTPIIRLNAIPTFASVFPPDSPPRRGRCETSRASALSGDKTVHDIAEHEQGREMHISDGAKLACYRKVL
jgi:hypothetical protein